MFEMALRGVRDGVKICPLIFVVAMIDLRRKKVRGENFETGRRGDREVRGTGFCFKQWMKIS